MNNARHSANRDTFKKNRRNSPPTGFKYSVTFFFTFSVIGEGRQWKFTDFICRNNIVNVIVPLCWAPGSVWSKCCPKFQSFYELGGKKNSPLFIFFFFKKKWNFIIALYWNYVAIFFHEKKSLKSLFSINKIWHWWESFEAHRFC